MRITDVLTTMGFSLVIKCPFRAKKLGYDSSGRVSMEVKVLGHEMAFLSSSRTYDNGLKSRP